MAFNGSGVFSRIYNWVNDRDASVPITASRMDAEMDGFATGLTNCVTKDGQTNPTADLPMNSNKHTGVENADARDQYAAAGQAQDSSFLWGGTAGGTADALTITLTPAITAYTAGQSFRFIANANNTGAATININGAGAKAIQNDGSALAADGIVSGKIYEIIYDGTQFQISQVKLSGGDVVDDLTPQLGGDLDGQGNEINSISGLFIDEAAAAAADVAGDGQFWVKDDTPNTPMFTDDAGNDQQLTLSVGTPQATTSGTTIDISISAGVKRFTITGTGVSTSGTSNRVAQLGDSGGVETSGYTGALSRDNGGSATFSSSFILEQESNASSITNFTLIFTLANESNNTWHVSGVVSDTVSNSNYMLEGYKSLSAELTTVRLTTANGTDTFDAGEANKLEGA